MEIKTCEQYVLDLRGRFPGCVEVGGEEERDGYRD